MWFKWWWIWYVGPFSTLSFEFEGCGGWLSLLTTKIDKILGVSLEIKNWNQERTKKRKNSERPIVPYLSEPM